jgi:DNA-binding NarL/FixJ family response regulator
MATRQETARDRHMTPRLRIVLVDDHRVVTRSLQAWLESFPDMSVVGTASTGEEVLQHLDSWRPDIVIQDLLMPGGLDGIETTERILERAPSVKVIALTASIDEPRMMGVLRAGAVGYLRKDAEPETLLAAVRAVAAGRVYIDPAVANLKVNRAPRLESLTSREIDVLRHLVAGLSNKDIGQALDIGEQTVKTHVSHVLAKLEVENRVQAIAEALRRRLVSIEDLQQR